MTVKKVKKVFQKNVTTVDAQTGEVLKDHETTTTITKQATNLFIRIYPEAINWLELDPIHYKAISVIAYYAVERDGFATGTKAYEALSKFMSYKKQGCYNIVQNLIKKNLLKRVSHNHYLINPHFATMQTTKIQKENIALWELLLKQTNPTE